MEQLPKNTIRPFLCLPPLALFPLILILGHSIVGDLQIDHLEQQFCPRDKALLALLMFAELENDASSICLENEVKDCWNVLGRS